MKKGHIKELRILGDSAIRIVIMQRIEALPSIPEANKHQDYLLETGELLYLHKLANKCLPNTQRVLYRQFVRKFEKLFKLRENVLSSKEKKRFEKMDLLLLAYEKAYLLENTRGNKFTYGMKTIHKNRRTRIFIKGVLIEFLMSISFVKNEHDEVKVSRDFIHKLNGYKRVTFYNPEIYTAVRELFIENWNYVKHFNNLFSEKSNRAVMNGFLQLKVEFETRNESAVA